MKCKCGSDQITYSLDGKVAYCQKCPNVWKVQNDTKSEFMDFVLELEKLLDLALVQKKMKGADPYLRKMKAAISVLAK